jgi:hypothetical protein
MGLDVTVMEIVLKIWPPSWVFARVKLTCPLAMGMERRLRTVTGLGVPTVNRMKLKERWRWGY